MEGWALINEQIGAWPPSEMEQMSLTDYCDWVKLALERAEQRAENRAE